MFDGVPDQFHQFITPRTSSLPLHLPFPLHASGTPNTTFPINFDPYNPSSHQLPLPLQPNNNHLLHPLHHKNEQDKEQNNTVPPMNFEIQRDHQRQQQQLPELVDPWTNEEVLALLRIRSSMESWFPELTWEHVSRKLAELGYKRSAEKCKEKFEEESRYFNNNINFGKNSNINSNNFRFLSELEQLYQSGGDHQAGTVEKSQQQQQLLKQDKMDQNHALEEEGDSRNIVAKQNDETIKKTTRTIKEKKRKRPDRFEMFKGFCVSVVHSMMAQQEEMHNKLLEDMMKRDEEKFTKEEAWKKQEMEKMNKELEMMAREQAIAGDRQANIIQILNKFSSSSTTTSSPESHTLLKVVTNNGSLNIIAQNPSFSQNTPPLLTENPTSSLAQDTLQVIPSSSSTSAPPVPNQNPSSSSLHSQNSNNPLEKNSVLNKDMKNEKDDVGRRWPKDEVLALINLRCTTVTNNNEEKEGNKLPLWERISQGMSKLGYKRSAKRCKEKWENINKYFRKTKDANKKRSLDSRTCPYFHQLSSLYDQGKLVLQSESHHLNNNHPPEITEERVSRDQTQADESSSQVGSGGFSVQQQVDHGGEKPLMQQQVPSLDYDQF